jgi:hypothetical protein
MTYQIPFTVSFDPDEDGYIVHQASRVFSFAMIPAKYKYYFGQDKAKAWDQVRRLNAQQAKGNEIALQTLETPSRFEAVADTKYGCAW